jgi:hypothetical protein
LLMQYERFKRRIYIVDLNKRWKHLILNTTVCTIPLLNLRPFLFMDMQPYYCTSVVAYHTNWAMWVAGQTFARHLA